MGFGGGGFGGGFDFNRNGSMDPAENMAEMNFVTGEDYDSDPDEDDYGQSDDCQDFYNEHHPEETYRATPMQISRLLKCKSEYEKLDMKSLVVENHEKSYSEFYEEVRELARATNLVAKNKDFYDHFNDLDLKNHSEIKTNETQEIGQFWIIIIKEAFLINKYENLFKIIICYNKYIISYAEYLSNKYPKNNIKAKALSHIEELRSKFINYSEVIHEKQIVEGEENIEALVNSTWDDNIEKLLNYKKIPWEFKSKIIYLRNGEKFIPDFILEDKSVICNLDNWKSRKWEQIEGFKKLFPNRKIIIIDPDIYSLLNEKFGNQIPGWKNEKVPTFNENIQVVGLMFDGREKYAEQLMAGDELLLQRESYNKFDNNAIKVLNTSGNQVGYVSREWAEIMATKMDSNCKYKMMVIENKGNTLECKVKIEGMELPEIFG